MIVKDIVIATLKLAVIILAVVSIVVYITFICAMINYRLEITQFIKVHNTEFPKAYMSGRFPNAYIKDCSIETANATTLYDNTYIIEKYTLVDKETNEQYTQCFQCRKQEILCKRIKDDEKLLKPIINR